MDTSELEAAYRAVLDLAARGSGDSSPGAASGEAGPGGGEAGPADGEAWGPDDVLAHLVLNDRLLARAVRSVPDGTASRPAGICRCTPSSCASCWSGRDCHRKPLGIQGPHRRSLPR
jgi:hypothetical protein